MRTKHSALTVVATLAVAAAASCGSTAVEPGASTTTAAPSATVAPGTTAMPATTDTTIGEHQANPSPGETAALAAELVPVPGYRYADVPAAERTADREAIGIADLRAASFHGVIDETSGDEIAFLVLAVVDPRDAMNAESYARRVAEHQLASPDVTPVTMSGQQVWTHEDPSRPASRFQYVWQRHGTLGWLDGPDQAATERFLQGYFAAPFTGAEDPLLGRRVVAVPGYSFTNAVDDRREADAAAALFPGAQASLHYVFDETHTFAGLVLAGPVAELSDQELVARVTTWMEEAGASTAPELHQVGERQVGDVTVHHLSATGSKLDLFVWQWPGSGVVGWVTTTRPDLAEPFLTAFLQAQPPAS